MRVLIGGYLAQAGGLGVTAIAIVAVAPVLVIYAGVVVASTAMTVRRPGQAVIVPSLARSAEELTATNVVSSWVESCAALLTSALAAVLLTVAGVDLAFGLTAALALRSALLVVGVDGPQPGAADDEAGTLSAAFVGFTALAGTRTCASCSGC